MALAKKWGNIQNVSNEDKKALYRRQQKEENLVSISQEMLWGRTNVFQHFSLKRFPDDRSTLLTSAEENRRSDIELSGTRLNATW